MSATSTWDATRVKAQLRLTAQRLGQLQDKKDSQGQITRRDIATLLQQGQVALARTKAQKLAREDALEVLLQVLEMHIGVILEHFSELENNSPPSPSLIEAASSIIYTANHYDESKDLHVTSNLLAQRLGLDFTRSAIGNHDAYVSPQILGALAAPPPTAARLDDFLVSIASAYGVEWKPAMRAHERLTALSELLDPGSPTLVVDLARLRSLCDLGIPGHPPWLRPRIWRLAFGTLPALKTAWNVEASKQRDSYYDLVRRLLEPFTKLPPPSSPLASLDKSLLDASKDISRVPGSLFLELEDEPESSTLCPLDPTCPEHIECSAALDDRLEKITAMDAKDSAPLGTPEIRLQGEEIPEISVSSPTSPNSGEQANTSRTLHPSKALNFHGAHPKHHSALVRLLYIHSTLNPASRSPHIASLLVPLYSVLVQEIEAADVCHAEADTFWLFESIISEFAELEDEEGGKLTLQRFGERMAWADEELFVNLQAKGLDPALPHYSYRWLAPLLTHTLPLSSVFSVWDAVFTRTAREKDSNPRLDYLLDVCTSMLIRARGPLFRLGKSGRRSPGLWNDDASIPPPSPLRAWELGDAFAEGMALLQLYPIEAAGGVESILQTASDLAHRREEEMKARRAGLSVGLGARLRETVWRGFTNRVSSPIDDEFEEEEDSEESTEPEPEPTVTQPAAVAASNSNGITSRLTTSIWKGITNQSAMEAPPSPLSPARSPSISPSPSPTPESAQNSPASATSSARIWDYTAKLKESDAAATLAKVSSNWRARALSAWGSGVNLKSVPSSTASEPPLSPQSKRDSLWDRRPESSSSWSGVAQSPARPIQHSTSSDTYSPPPRPSFFRPPRDSWMPHARTESISSVGLSPTSPESKPEGGLVDRAKALQESLSSLTGIQVAAPKPTPKAAPRPLLLSSSTLMTGHSRAASVSRGPSPAPSGHNRYASDATMSRRESQSSASSLGLTSRESWDSDAASRVVPIRRARSPMAPNFSMPRARSSTSSSATSDRSAGAARTKLSLSTEIGVRRTRSREGGWGQVEAADPMLRSADPHQSEVTDHTAVEESDWKTRGGSLAPSESLATVRPEGSQPDYLSEVTSDSSVAGIGLPKSPRSKVRKMHRPANLRIGHDIHSLYAPEADAEDAAATPRAAQFEGSAVSSPSPPTSATAPPRRKLSNDGGRKLPGEGHAPRVRKISTGSHTKAKARPRDSEAEQGDDEGYDDLLSAYESEEGGPGAKPRRE
ncbi:hypothetical protein PUNSTDRAFT_144929 [Punctularia strigosozonata HHB-11173 SS5]|uniref:uncharacterized protein n=1 Tax=Punctularia strigosozonata (strain HHB-11173) TaxID=741275 RepID=UPI0004417E4D|nr:uncharacterized protein PUNSTDRAFT_144929 [Punctularia strigosozonata HHB-11173 SS5]EIN07452.1 hypothetical protein PUNSTDRAFT_144929 [Punctularia strigosozonata HHB-11173 SS5]